jgi:hypothetical protein
MPNLRTIEEQDAVKMMALFDPVLQLPDVTYKRIEELAASRIVQQTIKVSTGLYKPAIRRIGSRCEADHARKRLTMCDQTFDQILAYAPPEEKKYDGSIKSITPSRKHRYVVLSLPPRRIAMSARRAS